MGKARTSAKPVRLSATSNLHVPFSMLGKEKKRDRRMEKGPRKWIENKWARRGRQVQFLAVSHWSPVPSSMPWMIRERERRVNSRQKTSFGEEGCRKGKKIEKQKIEKICARRGRLLSLFGYQARTSAKPVRLSATSNVHVPSSMPGKEKERPGQKDGWRAKKVDREKIRQGGDVR